jgi:hypothetical protein
MVIIIGMILVSMAHTQITITSNEWPTAVGTHFTYFVTEDTIGNGIPVNLGPIGGPQSWTFSETMYPVGELFTATIVDPISTPYTTTFPTADHAWNAFGQSGGFTFNEYSYLQISSVAWLSLGYGGTYGGFSIIEDNVPDDLILEFPATLGTSWASNYSVTSNPFPGAIEIDSTSRSSVIDAWGTIQVPTGSYNCLRVRDEETSIYNVYVSGILVSTDTIFSYTYSWIAEQEGWLAEVQSREDELNPNFSLAEEVTFRTTPPTGLNDTQISLSNGFRLNQNYPNPFNPVTMIEYNVPRSSELEVSVYNLLGQRVKILFSGKQEAGTHRVEFDGTDLPSGIYLYQLKSNNFVAYKKCVLLK